MYGKLRKCIRTLFKLVPTCYPSILLSTFAFLQNYSGKIDISLVHACVCVLVYVSTFVHHYVACCHL